eukprot:m.67844 g.67844  ORF g.67844 m.67844 type:complete len:436 (+) comp8472_c0_seq2:61-1368(+)
MRRLKRCGIPPEPVARCERKSINTVGDVLSRPMFDLIESVGLTLSQACLLMDRAAAAATPQHCTAAILLQGGHVKTAAPTPSTASTQGHACVVDNTTVAHASHQRFISTSVSTLDAALRGGVLAGTVTEIGGPPGAGKTQFCTMMAVQGALPQRAGGLGGTVVFIDTEGAFTAERFVEMARGRCHTNAQDLVEVVNRVKVIHEPTCASLLARLQSLEELIIKWRVRVVIVDSIASLVRKEYDAQSSRERSELLATEAALLKRIADKFGIVVLVSNQVTTLFSDRDEYHASAWTTSSHVHSKDTSDTYEPSTTAGPADVEEDDNDGVMHDVDSGVGHGSFVTTALGNTWSHAVNTRLVLEFIEGTANRLVRIIKSPLVPKASCEVSITSGGLIAAEGSEVTLADSHVTTDPRIAVRHPPAQGTSKLDLHNNIVSFQ